MKHFLTKTFSETVHFFKEPTFFTHHQMTWYLRKIVLFKNIKPILGSVNFFFLTYLEINVIGPFRFPNLNQL